MMKKACRSYVSLLAIALVAVLVLSACGGSDEPTATPRPTATPVPETTAPEPAPTSAPTEPSAPTATPVPGAPAPAPTATPTSAPPPPTATPLPSFDAEAHFKGKTVRILVGFNPGGGTDTQARFLAAKWGQYIPGRPRIVISNLTPSLAANNFLFESEPNGLILIYNATAPIQSSTEPEAKFKASDFEVIGAPVARNAVWMINGHDLPYNDITDAMGASGPTLIAAGSAPTPQELVGVGDLGNFLLADWLNLPYEFKLVASTGTEQELLMIERGDTNNFTAGSVWYQLPQRRPGWISSGFIKPFAGLAGPGGLIVGNAEAEEFTASYARDLITDEQKDIWDGLMAPETFVGKNLLAPPDTPLDIVNTLRKAWDEALADPEFRADFERILGQPIEIQQSGAELQGIFAQVEDAFLRNIGQLREVQEGVYDKFTR